MPGDPGRDRALRSFAEQLTDRQRKRARRINLKLIGSNEHFNFVKAGDQFVAVSKSLGPTALYAECLGERDLGTLILVAASYDEVRRRADETEA